MSLGLDALQGQQEIVLPSIIEHKVNSFIRELEEINNQPS